MMQDELVLLNRARSLEQEALAEIHEQYYTPIYRYISFRVGDIQTVEDLTSDVFLRLLDALRDRNAPQITLRSWLYGVASNVVKEHYRQERRANLIDLDESVPCNGRSLPLQMESKQLLEKLLTILNDITEDQKNVLALRFGFEMPIMEVAQVMGKSVGAVKMSQTRAIAALSNRIPAGSMAV